MKGFTGRRTVRTVVTTGSTGNITLSAADQLIVQARDKARLKGVTLEQRVSQMVGRLCAGTLHVEDLQHWQLVRGQLRIVNPFLDMANEIDVEVCFRPIAQ